MEAVADSTVSKDADSCVTVIRAPVGVVNSNESIIILHYVTPALATDKATDKVTLASANTRVDNISVANTGKKRTLTIVTKETDGVTIAGGVVGGKVFHHTPLLIGKNIISGTLMTCGAMALGGAVNNVCVANNRIGGDIMERGATNNGNNTDAPNVFLRNNMIHSARVVGGSKGSFRRGRN